MDNVSLAAMAAAAFPLLFTEPTIHIMVPHCKGIIALSYTTYPCVTTDPEKYPNWECIAQETMGGMEETYHSACITKNTESSTCSYCQCSESPRYDGLVNIKVSDSMSFHSPTAWFNDVSSSRCMGCRDYHANTAAVCPFCGEVH